MSSYLQKIGAERVVLRAVNKQYGDNALHGLSTGAITAWAKHKNVPTAFVAEVSKVGELVGAMCERSGERDTHPDHLKRVRANLAVRRFENRNK